MFPFAQSFIKEYAFTFIYTESPLWVPTLYAQICRRYGIHYLSTYMMFVRVNPGLITPYAVELGGGTISVAIKITGVTNVSSPRWWFPVALLMWVKQCHVYHPLGMVSMPPLKMVMTGEWFMIVLPTTLPIEDAFCSRHLPCAACVLLGLESQV